MQHGSKANCARELRTPRKQAMIGTITEIGGQTVLLVKSGKKLDFITLEELTAELLDASQNAEEASAV